MCSLYLKTAFFANSRVGVACDVRVDYLSCIAALHRVGDSVYSLFAELEGQRNVVHHLGVV